MLRQSNEWERKEERTFFWRFSFVLCLVNASKLRHTSRMNNENLFSMPSQELKMSQEKFF